MRIGRLETVPYALRFRESYRSARGTLERRELLLVRLRAQGGAVGLGEAAPLALRGGAGLADIRRELHETCGPLLEDAKLTISSLAGLVTVIRESGVSLQTVAAVDLALHDLAGKIEGEPVWKLLGGRGAGPVPCNATLPAGEPAHIAELASGWAERGFDTFKLKVGLDGDRETARAVRDAVGAGGRIRLDANGAWSLDEAASALRELELLGIELVEQPVAALEDLASLRRRTRIPIAADESVVTADDARRAVEIGACDLATVKVAKCGGLAAGLELAAEIPLYLSSALDGPLGIAAGAHLAQAIPRAWLSPAHGLATMELFEGTIASRGCELDGANLVVPDEPGLGIEIDELALRRHAL